jgi:hypothetical protein
MGMKALSSVAKSSRSASKGVAAGKVVQKKIDPVTVNPKDKPLNDMSSRRLNYSYDRIKLNSDKPLQGKINAYASTYGKGPDNDNSSQVIQARRRQGEFIFG